jgi:hypothetical protein
MDREARNGQDEEFKNFKELTKKLLVVPKKEMDKQRAERRKRKRQATSQPGSWLAVLVSTLRLAR